MVLLWQATPRGPKVRRVLLPTDGAPTEQMLRALRADARPGSCPAMAGLGEQMTCFLQGEDIVFPLDLLLLETCSEFQQRVLRAVTLCIADDARVAVADVETDMSMAEYP